MKFIGIFVVVLYVFASLNFIDFKVCISDHGRCVMKVLPAPSPEQPSGDAK